MSRLIEGNRHTIGGPNTEVSTCTLDKDGEIISARLDYIEYHHPHPPHKGPVFVLGTSGEEADVFVLSTEGRDSLAVLAQRVRDGTAFDLVDGEILGLGS